MAAENRKNIDHIQRGRIAATQLKTLMKDVASVLAEYNSGYVSWLTEDDFATEVLDSEGEPTGVWSGDHADIVPDSGDDTRKTSYVNAIATLQTIYAAYTGGQDDVLEKVTL